MCFNFKTLLKVILITIILKMNFEIHIVAIGVNDYFSGSFNKLLTDHLRLDAVLCDAETVVPG